MRLLLPALCTLLAAAAAAGETPPPAPEAALAEQLAAAPDEAAREALLAGVAASPALVQALVDAGQARLTAGTPDPAQPLYAAAERLAGQAGDQAGLAAALHGQGECHRLRGEHPEARAFFERALPAARAAGNAYVEGRALSGLGLVAEWEGDLEGALELLQQSRARFEAAGSPRGQALAMNNIASVYATRGEPEQSLPLFEEVLALARQAGDKLLEGRALNNIGYTLLRLGRYAEAYTSLSAALEHAEREQHRLTQLLALHNLANLHVRQGDPERGLVYARQGLALAQGAGLKQAEANAWADVGEALGTADDHAAALEAYQRSLAAFAELEDVRGQAAALGGVATARSNLGDCAGALGDYARAAELARQAGAAEDEAYAVSEQADCELRLGRAEPALAGARQALDLARGSDRMSYQRALVLLGRAQRALGQREAALASFAEAAAIVDELRAAVAGGEATRERFLSASTDPYLALAELHLAEGRTAEALAQVERAKGRVLLDVLAAGRVQVRKLLTAAERAEEQRLEQELAELGRELRRERQRRRPEAARAAEMEGRLTSARRAREDLLTRLYSAHPGLRTLRGEVAPLSTSDLAELAPDAGTALLEYSLGPDGLSLFVVAREGGEPRLTLHRLGDGAAVARDVRELRRRLAARDLEAAALSRRLYDQLLRPAAARLAGRPHLVVIPDGALWELPFQALSPRTGRYLVEDHSLSYAPSLTVLREMRRRREGAPAAGPRTLLAFGNPSLGETRRRQGLALMGGETLAPLPEAEQQVRGLARLYGGRGARVYVGAEASEARAKAEAPRAQVLHFATHGLLDGSDPL